MSTDLCTLETCKHQSHYLWCNYASRPLATQRTLVYSLDNSPALTSALHLCDCGSYNHIIYCCKYLGACTLTSDLWPLYNVCTGVQWSLANTMTLCTNQASWVGVGTAKGYVNWLEPRYDEHIQKHSSQKQASWSDSKHHCVTVCMIRK